MLVSGTIPEELCGLGALKELRISCGKLTGMADEARLWISDILSYVWLSRCSDLRAFHGVMEGTLFVP